MAHADRELKQEIELTVDGKEVGLPPFVKEIMGKSIAGILVECRQF